jgi:hypothetical protein
LLHGLHIVGEAVKGDETGLQRAFHGFSNLVLGEHIVEGGSGEQAGEVDFAIVEESPAILGILGKYGVQVVMENNIRSGCILQTENETFNFDILDAYERAVRELRGEKK